MVVVYCPISQLGGVNYCRPSWTGKEEEAFRYTCCLGEVFMVLHLTRIFIESRSLLYESVEFNLPTSTNSKKLFERTVYQRIGFIEVLRLSHFFYAWCDHDFVGKSWSHQDSSDHMVYCCWIYVRFIASEHDSPFLYQCTITLLYHSLYALRLYTNTLSPHCVTLYMVFISISIHYHSNESLIMRLTFQQSHDHTKHKRSQRGKALLWNRLLVHNSTLK